MATSCDKDAHVAQAHKKKKKKNCAICNEGTFLEKTAQR